MTFSKNENCPTSQELVDFQNGDIEADEGRVIREHLSGCEFCEAEIEFYSHYPQAVSGEEESNDAAADIPAPLYELAEALLKNKQPEPEHFLGRTPDEFDPKVLS